MYSALLDNSANRVFRGDNNFTVGVRHIVYCHQMQRQALGRGKSHRRYRRVPCYGGPALPDRMKVIKPFRSFEPEWLLFLCSFYPLAARVIAVYPYARFPFREFGLAGAELCFPCQYPLKLGQQCLLLARGSPLLNGLHSVWPSEQSHDCGNVVCRLSLKRD